MKNLDEHTLLNAKAASYFNELPLGTKLLYRIARALEKCNDYGYYAGDYMFDMILWKLNTVDIVSEIERIFREEMKAGASAYDLTELEGFLPNFLERLRGEVANLKY